MKNICPVCGFDGLAEPAYDKDGNASFEICECCGFEFGFDDESEGKTFEGYREKWVASGDLWQNEEAKPLNWSLEKQLRNIVT